MQKERDGMELRFERFSAAHAPAVRKMFERDAQNAAPFLRVLVGDFFASVVTPSIFDRTH